MNRKNRRLRFTIPVLVTRHSSGKEKSTCRILELNRAGLLVETALKLSEGENITVHLLREEIELKVISSSQQPESEVHQVQLEKLNDEMDLDFYFSSFSRLTG